MSLQNTSQKYFQSLTTDQLISKGHVYRKIISYFDFNKICKEFEKFYDVKGAPGYEVERVSKH